MIIDWSSGGNYSTVIPISIWNWSALEEATGVINWPQDKSMTMIGPSKLSVMSIGPTSKTISKVS